MRRLMVVPMLALAAAGARAQRCQDGLPSASVVVEARTVALRSDSGVQVLYDRPTGAWRRTAGLRVFAGDTLQHSLCLSWADTVSLAPGVRLAAREPAGGARWLLHDDALAQPLPLRIAARVRRQAQPARQGAGAESGEEPTEFSPDIASWLRDGNLVWLGLYGSYTGDGNYLGGLLRYSLRTHTLRSFAPKLLRKVMIPSMAVAGGSLWLATQRHEDSEYYRHEQPGVGLVQLTPNGAFHVFSARTTPLPDDMIGAVGGSGDSLWVVTESGVALLDTRTMKWDRRFFREVFTLDSTYVTLTEDSVPTVADEAREAAFILMDKLEIPPDDCAGFLAAALAEPGPLADLLGVWNGNAYGPMSAGYMRGTELRAVDILSQPTLLPFVKRALRAGGGPWLGSQVLLALGDSVWLQELHEALRAAPRNKAVWVAGLLAESGDAEALAWIRQALRDRTLWADTSGGALEHLIHEAETHPDTANVPGLLDALSAPGRAAHQALVALWLMNDAALRADMAHRIVDDPALALDWLIFAAADTADPRHEQEPQRSARRELAHAVLRWALTLSDSAVNEPVEPPAVAFATRAAAELRDASAIPLLLRMLTRPPRLSYPANEALIRLTAVQPPPLSWGEGWQRSAGYWDGWWQAHAAGFVPVSRAAGLAALKAWLAPGR